MYLEISQPGSGKTTRLVTEATRLLVMKPEQHVLVINPREAFAECTARMVTEQTRRLPGVTGGQRIHWGGKSSLDEAHLSRLSSHVGRGNLAVMLDDVDHWANSRPPGIFTGDLEPVSYAVTSPEYLHDPGDIGDLLFRLWLKAGGRYSSFPTHMGDEAFRTQLPAAAYSIEFGLRWLKLPVVDGVELEPCRYCLGFDLRFVLKSYALEEMMIRCVACGACSGSVALAEFHVIESEAASAARIALAHRWNARRQN